jgi:lysyl-tRNA synthetase class 2
VCHIAQTLFGGLRIVHHGDTEGTEKRVINLQRPWRRVCVTDLVAERTGWIFDKRPLKAERVDQLRSANPGKDLKFNGSPAEQLVEVYEKLIEPTLIDPTFVTHIPSVIIPLARKNREDDFFADVYELAINGQEISPGYSELNDPDVQAANFTHQVGDEEEKQKVDEDFLDALRHGMPPAGGMGLGVDRLMTMLTGAQSLRDVILFPLMKPVEGT